MNQPTGPRQLPPHGPCFVCGPDNPSGMGVRWFATSREVVADLRFTAAQQGPPDHAHGGATASVLDEAMGAAVWVARHRAMAASLTVDYRQPVPLEQALRVEARLDRVEGRKAYASAQLLRAADRTVLAESSGLYVAVPEFFDRTEAHHWEPHRALDHEPSPGDPEEGPTP